MEKYFGKNFRNIKNKMFKIYPNGFYVNNKLEDDGYKFNSKNFLYMLLDTALDQLLLNLEL